MNQLTKTENKIARLVALGYVEKEIAHTICVSVHTVHTHTRNIRKKLNARNIADITREYILSLDNPKQLFLALLFTSMQLAMVASAEDFECRKVSQNFSKVRTSKTRRYDC